MIEYPGRNTHAATDSATVEVAPTSGFWPARGSLVSVLIRKTAGSATKFAWSVYSENPADLPAGRELSEFMLLGAFNLGGNDERATCNNDVAVPDAFVQVTDGVIWEPKSAVALNKLWVVITYDAGADNEGLVSLLAAPNPDPKLPQPPV